jgi:hypothetical protein
VSGKYQYRPVLDRRPDEQTIRERAAFLAHEIYDDRLAPEAEIADAIELEIKRFARPEYITGPGGYFAVVDCRRGPLKRHRNGRTAYEWAVLVLSCGHELVYERLKNPRLRPPASALCREVH